MFILSRRAFLGWLAATLPGAALTRAVHALAVDDLVSSPATMLALGEAVLPGELGAAGVASAVKAFQQWIAGYRAGAELVHGYGTSSLGRTGPTPATKWAGQLDQLDAVATKRDGKSFAALGIARRREMVQSELTSIKADRIPPLVRAPHVALALLAHFYASPEASDQCYEAQIGRHRCRPLAASGRRPLPLAESRT